jgi:hypothetical protein
MLATLQKRYKRKSHKVTEWAAELADKRIWRGSGVDSSSMKGRPTRSKYAIAMAAAKKRDAASRKTSRSKTPSSKTSSRKPSSSRTVSANATPAPPPQAKLWTKGQREEAARVKSEEADEAEMKGLRRSRRAHVPSEKALNGVQ